MLTYDRHLKYQPKCGQTIKLRKKLLIITYLHIFKTLGLTNGLSDKHIYICKQVITLNQPKDQTLLKYGKVR